LTKNLPSARVEQIFQLSTCFNLQIFNQPSHVFQPGVHPENLLTFGDEHTNIPVAVQVQYFTKSHKTVVKNKK
jgi:hypothetical protein